MTRGAPFSVAAAALFLTGCAAAWSAGVGPTVDTEGRVGLLVSGRMAVGLGSEDTAYVVGFEGGVGPALDAGLGVSYGASAFDVERFEPALFWRLGLRGGWAGRFGRDQLDSRLIAGGVLAVMAPLSEARYPGHEKMGGGGRTVWGLGAELRAMAAWPADGTGGSPAGTPVGLFALLCTFESLSLVHLF